MVSPEDGAIKGMIYAPFVAFIGGERFGIKGEVVTSITASDLPALMQRSQFFVASIHHAIRWSDQEAPGKGVIWCLLPGHRPSR